MAKNSEFSVGMAELEIEEMTDEEFCAYWAASEEETRYSNSPMKNARGEDLSDLDYMLIGSKIMLEGMEAMSEMEN